jgi:hypothetical protein
MGLLDKSRFLDYEKACIYATSNPENCYGVNMLGSSGLGAQS